MKSDRPYIMHMLQEIKDIESYQIPSREDFFKDRKTQNAVVRNIQVLGQAAHRISAKTKKLAPDIEWKKIIGTRNVLVHDYTGINYRVVWTIMEEFLPPLKQQLEILLQNPDLQ